MIRRLFLFALAAVSLVGAVPVHATTVEGFTLSDGQPRVTREYGPLIGADPAGEALVPTMAQCDANPADALIPIEMSFKDTLHVAEFEVSWENPDANNVQIYFFDEIGELIAESASEEMPEMVSLGSLENGQYYLCVRNYSGPNTGFVVDADVRLFDYYSRGPDDFPTPQPRPTAAPESTSRPRPATTDTSEPAPAGDEVATPGPDGPFSDRGLVNVAGSRQAAREEGGRSVAQWVFIGLTGLIAAGGATLVALRIRRDTSG